MNRENDGDVKAIRYTGSIIGIEILQGTLDEFNLWWMLLYMLDRSFVSKRLYPGLKTQIPQIGEKSLGAIEKGEVPELSAILHQAVGYVRENINEIVSNCVWSMLHEGLLAASPQRFREEKGWIDKHISFTHTHLRLDMKERLRQHFNSQDSQPEKKASYALNYPSFLDQWQRSELIYENWLTEVRTVNGGDLKSEDLRSEEWKRRINNIYPDTPDDLLNRLVDDPQNPCYVGDIDDYERNPSRIAAIHTARFCGIPEDLSYVTYMRIRREGERATRGVTEPDPNDDTY